jgi:hypothetical protein
MEGDDGGGAFFGLILKINGPPLSIRIDEVDVFIT